MAKKFFKGSTGSRIVSAAMGGAASAVMDKYITPMLPDTLQESPDYAKAGVGLLLPIVFKNNKTVDGISDGLLACAMSNIVAGMLPEEEEKKKNTTNTTSDLGSARYCKYRAAVRRGVRGIGDPAAASNMVGNAQAAKNMVC